MGPRAWRGRPTGRVGRVDTSGTCDRACGALGRSLRHACECGGPGGVGYLPQEWWEKIGQTAYLNRVLDGALVPSLATWEDLPSEISTQVPVLLEHPGRWLKDMVGRSAATRATGGEAETAAAVANAALYRWWCSGPAATPGPGTLFMPITQANGRPGVGIVAVDPEQVQVNRILWSVSAPRAEALVWLHAPDTTSSVKDDEERERAAEANGKSLPSHLSLVTRLKRTISAPLGDAAFARGLPRPELVVRVDSGEWDLVWELRTCTLFMTGGDRHQPDTISVVLVDGASGEVAESAVPLAKTPWGAFFDQLSERERTQAVGG